MYNDNYIMRVDIASDLVLMFIDLKLQETYQLDHSGTVSLIHNKLRHLKDKSVLNMDEFSIIIEYYLTKEQYNDIKVFLDNEQSE